MSLEFKRELDELELDLQELLTRNGLAQAAVFVGLWGDSGD